MSLTILKTDLKEKIFKKLYYICGDELYLKRFYLEQLRIAATDGDMPDYTNLEGKKLTLPEFTEQLGLLPVAGERKMIVVRDIPLNSPVVDFLIQNPDRLEADTVLVIFAETEKYDQRTKDYKAFIKLVQNNGLAVCIDPLDEKTLQKWTAQNFKKRGKEISPAAVGYLLENTDNDMYMLLNETDKLAAYTFGRAEVTTRDIDAVCIKTVDAKVYELTDAVLHQNADAALEICEKLYEMGTNANLLLGALFNAVGGLYKTKLLSNGKDSAAEIAKKTGMKEFVVKKNLQKLQEIPDGRLEEMIESCTQADMVAKSSCVDAEIIITQLICKCIGLLHK